MTEPELSRILVRLERRGIEDEAVPPLATSAILMASGPEILIKEIAPTPMGVATAAIVEVWVETMGFDLRFRERRGDETSEPPPAVEKGLPGGLGKS